MGWCITMSDCVWCRAVAQGHPGVACLDHPKVNIVDQAALPEHVHEGQAGMMIVHDEDLDDLPQWGMVMIDCLWCQEPDSEDVDDPRTLCRDHEAEWEGMSVDELDRRDREQLAEWLDHIN